MGEPHSQHFTECALPPFMTAFPEKGAIFGDLASEGK
jgi:hypothetical protein